MRWGDRREAQDGGNIYIYIHIYIYIYITIQVLETENPGNVTVISFDL